MFDKSELKQKVIEKLKTIGGYGLPVSIYELGLIYKIDISEKKGNVQVDIDMTTINNACSDTNSFIARINQTITQIDGIDKSEVHLVYTPRWDFSKISPSALEKLKALNAV